MARRVRLIIGSRSIQYPSIFTGFDGVAVYTQELKSLAIGDEALSLRWHTSSGSTNWNDVVDFENLWVIETTLGTSTT
jgi:hypothetical protein